MSAEIGPVTSGEGVSAVVLLRVRLLGSLTRGVRLFNKNITGCKTERFSIAGDACPVRVSETWVQPGQGLVNGGPNLEALKVA